MSASADPVAAFFALHASLRETSLHPVRCLLGWDPDDQWIATLTSAQPGQDNLRVHAIGYGSTREEACQDALDYIVPEELLIPAACEASLDSITSNETNGQEGNS